MTTEFIGIYTFRNVRMLAQYIIYWSPKMSSLTSKTPYWWTVFLFMQCKFLMHCHPLPFSLLLPSLPSPFSTYVNARCELPTPADRCGSANHLHFHTHPPPPSGPRGDVLKPAGCRRAACHGCKPLAQKWSCAGAAQAGEQVVTRPGERHFKPVPVVFLTGIKNSTVSLW